MTVIGQKEQSENLNEHIFLMVIWSEIKADMKRKLQQSFLPISVKHFSNKKENVGWTWSILQAFWLDG